MKRATAYMRKGTIFLHASNMTTAGVWILGAPVLLVDGNDPSRIGNFAFKALDGSRTNIQHPSREDLGKLFDPILSLANVKSWAAFSEAARCVTIAFEGNRISLIPTKRLGPKHGFAPVQDKTRCSAPVERELGEALLLAFEDTEQKS